MWNYRVEGGGYAQLPRRTESTASPVECRGRRRWSWTSALESRTTHTAPSTADLHLSHPCSTFCHASKPALIAPIVPFERMAAHCSSLMRRTSIPDPHAVTSPAPPLHPLQPLQTTCHGAAKSAMTSCSRRGSSLHQSGHPHHICIRQALRQGTSGTAANGKQGTCGLVSRFSTTFSVGHGACLFRRTRMMPNPSTSTPLQRSGRAPFEKRGASDPEHVRANNSPTTGGCRR